MLNPSLPSLVAKAVLADESSVDGICARVARTLGRNWKWIRPFARRYVIAYEGRTRPRHRDVVGFLLRDKSFRRASLKHFDKLRVAQWLTGPPAMQPVAAAASWEVPAIESVGALAHWLQLEPSELEWFADLRGLASHKHQPAKLAHYRYQIVTKRNGHLRLIEAPKPRLKEIQRTILAGILDHVPAHSAAHGFRPGRSIKSFAQPHTGHSVVLRMDLQDFFPSISGARVQSLFRTIGYPEPVADRLGGICTNGTPRGVWNTVPVTTGRRELQDLYARPHLPQGAPTSPSLANLCAYRMDLRLDGLAKSSGAVYTRYADDLAFSGDAEFARRVERFSVHAAAILYEEGFPVNHRKTRIMRQGVRQHLAGLTTNKRINVKRPDFDRLKATLTNCVRHGVGSQNREAHPQFRSHLEGRVSFVEMINPEKGRRLRTILDRIQW